MKKQFLLWALLLLIPVYSAAQTVIAPGIKSKTTFAIVIDKESYDKAGDAVRAYRNVVERDNLGTYIICDDWKSPEEIRAILEKLHNDKTPLEGVVFVGDIPIPMIRDAHHLSSAFKMDPKHNWQRSSIPSDRYYDDFGLKFDFIKRDSLNPELFYYSLRPDAEQFIESDIYSARIRPLGKGKEGKYAQLEKYLLKVVRERTENRENRVNNLSMGRGHGYNSESRAAWAGEQIALKEQFPQAFNTGGNVRFMDFESRYPIKPFYINEILRPELDIMLFHHHGSNDYQYLNGGKSGSDQNTSIANVKLYLRSKIQSAVENGTSREEAIQYYMKYLDVPRSWCEEAFDPAKIAQDSVYYLMQDISVKDVLSVAPNARFVMFDACFNGSFHRDENIAGAYIFNDGKTIVTQGNTVNTIQDKWPDLYLGLLAGGVRVGMWGKEVHFLETHIIGDPTFRFANTTLDFDINEALAVKAGDNKFWLAKTNHPSVDVQAIAYALLYRNGYAGLSDMLLSAYRESPSFIVRMQALTLLAKIDDRNFIEVLKLAVDDSYELVRRFAVDYICRNGSDELIPALVKSAVTDNTSERILFKVREYSKMVDHDKVVVEVDKYLRENTLYDKSVAEEFKNATIRGKESVLRDLAAINDPSTSEKARLSEIRSFRNHPAARGVDVLLAFVADDSRALEQRVAAAEALGWYIYSYRKGDIIAGLNKLADSVEEKQLLDETRKSINRLNRP